MSPSSTDVLRFLTAGSVDDGKSTLIGRLLYDSRTLAVDQAQSLSRRQTGSGPNAPAEDKIDFSLLTDGLEAEREQGITIDVAWRYFTSEKRRFIIADTPGHEQYTRNMVTGASQADAAIILIDATKVEGDGDHLRLLDQTRRHTAIVRLLGIPHVIAAINKIDLLDDPQGRFETIRDAFASLARHFGVHGVHTVPVSALRGDNVVHKSQNTPWYDGPTLLSLLEDLPTSTERLTGGAALRLPVQSVLREGGSTHDDFRGYQGRIEAGDLTVGQKVRILPAGRETTVAEIFTPDGPVSQATHRDNVTVRLTDEVDISRGDMIVAGDSDVPPASVIHADVCWFDDIPLNTARKYIVQHTTRRVFGRITRIDRVLDVCTLSHATGAGDIRQNDIGRVEIRLQQPLIVDPYDQNPKTGSFVLIDEASNHTVGAGMICSAA